ncbi:MAG TPA: glycosyltransferase family A protein [Candidatus Dojkabacteria bacterium]|nr:glycosyltransferase family A protein [Candidatus Dojkabacteria bacterium]
MKSSTPLITVVIPVYNGAETIQRAILSTLSQDYPNYEVLAVNDGSTDKTLEILKQIDSSRFRYISLDKNGGRSEARNTGVKNARGEYIAFLDADDAWMPNHLTSAIHHLSNRDSNWKATITSHLFFNGKKWKKIIHTKEGDLFKDILMVNVSLGAGSTLVIEKSIFDEIGYFKKGLSRNEDLEFMLRYLLKYKLGATSEISVKVHGHSSKPIGEEYLKAKKEYFKVFDEQIRSLPVKTQNKVYARQWLQVARAYSIEGNLKETINYLKISLKSSLLFSKYIPIFPFEGYFVIILNLFKSLLR